jgi:O-antigen ligase
MFMILPLILWKAHLGRGRVRAVWSILLVLAASMLILSVARSSILAAVVLAGAYGLSLSLARKGAFLFFGGLGIVATVLMMPGTLDKFEARYVRKNTVVQGSSVMFSRQGPWKLSLEMARQGGIVGAGYGVSIGGGTFTGGLTAFGYGREKGNSQLAIVEETGIVGLMLYGLVVVALLGRLSRAFRASRNRDARALVGIVLGAILGELVLGVFEAWWVAPGSPESLWFWTIVGVALGVCDASLPQPGRRATPVSTNPRMAVSASRR